MVEESWDGLGVWVRNGTVMYMWVEQRRVERCGMTQFLLFSALTYFFIDLYHFIIKKDSRMSKIQIDGSFSTLLVVMQAVLSSQSDLSDGQFGNFDKKRYSWIHAGLFVLARYQIRKKHLICFNIRSRYTVISHSNNSYCSHCYFNLKITRRQQEVLQK